MIPISAIGLLLLTGCSHQQGSDDFRLTEAEKTNITLAKADTQNAKSDHEGSLNELLEHLRNKVFKNKNLRALSSKVFSITSGEALKFGDVESQHFAQSDVSDLAILGKDYFRNIARVLIVERHEAKDDFYCVYCIYLEDQWYLIDGAIQRKSPFLWRHALARIVLELDAFHEKGKEAPAAFKALYSKETAARFLEDCESRYLLQKKAPVGLWFQMLYSGLDTTVAHALKSFETLLGQTLDSKSIDATIGQIKQSLYAKYDDLKKLGIGGATDEVPK